MARSSKNWKRRYYRCPKWQRDRLTGKEVNGLNLRASALSRELRRNYLLERDGSLCAYCERDLLQEGVKMTIDHVVPLSAGGADELANLALACYECNRAKGNLPVEFFLQIELWALLANRDPSQEIKRVA